MLSLGTVDVGMLSLGVLDAFDGMFCNCARWVHSGRSRRLASTRYIHRLAVTGRVCRFAVTGHIFRCTATGQI